MSTEELLWGAREDLSHGFAVRAGTRLRQAVAAGSSEALPELAQALLSRRIPGNFDEARELLEQAGDELPPALYMARATLRHAGTGGTCNSGGALHDLAAAAHAGLPEAAVELALVWLEFGSTEAVQAAFSWLHRAARRNDLAGELLGLLAVNATADQAPPSVPDEWPAVHQPQTCQTLCVAPCIKRYPELFTAIECHWLRARARARLAPSLVVDPRSGQPRPDPIRTGETMCFDPSIPSLFALRLAERMAGLTGQSPDCSEPLAVLHYRPGQQYMPHYDWLGERALQSDPLRDSGDRAATVLAYLNAPRAGGATLFTRLNIRVEPIPGDGLVFFNLDATGRPEQDSQHAGEPVAEGEKWLASLWVRSRPVRL